MWENNNLNSQLQNRCSESERTGTSTPNGTPRSLSPLSRQESIFNKYIDIIQSKSNICTEAKLTEQSDRPFDFFDDEEFAFGVNLLNNKVACAGDNITKLIQMAQEPWPDNVKLYQPYEVEQILLPDNANCLAVQAFLKMCNLPFEVEMRWNAEFMSPSGRVPFIKCGAFVVSELEPIVQFAANKGVTLSSRLSTEEKAEMRAYMSLVTNVLHNAELYVSWIDSETYNAVTKVRNSSVYPWPLGWIQTRSKRNAVIKRLKALHWHDKTMEQVLYDVEQCCNSLSQRLGERDYFFGTPTALDALICGHIRALLSAQGPKSAAMIKPITSVLLSHTLRMARLTNMKLTPQEDYLISQAIYIAGRHRFDDKARTKKSKLGLQQGIQNIENPGVVYSKAIFGFKPFDKKQIVMMTEGKESRNKLSALYDEEKYQIVNETLDEVLTKVDEISLEIVPDKEVDEMREDRDFNREKTEFLLVDTKYKDGNRFEIEYLTTIEECSMNTLSNSTEIIPVINNDCVVGDDDDVIKDRSVDDEFTDHDLTDIEGLTEDMIDKSIVSNTEDNIDVAEILVEVTDSSNIKSMTATSSCDKITTETVTSKKSESNSFPFTESSLTLKGPNEDENVESLLKYIRSQKNTYHAPYMCSPEVTDID